MSYFRRTQALLCLVFIVRCGSTPKIEDVKRASLPPSEAEYRHANPRNGKYNQIDVGALLYELNMDRPLTQLGFTEKSFNTCAIKSNQSPTPYCQRLYLVRLNYQILCRKSTGTVTKVKLRPFYSKRLRWRHRGFRGQSETTQSGFGSLGFVSPKSAQQGRLYFYLDSKIALKRLSDNWKLVLPDSWCANP